MEQTQAQSRSDRINYAMTAFLVKKQYSVQILKGPLRLRDRDEHRALVQQARADGNVVWYADVYEEDGKKKMSNLHIVDWGSFVEEESDPTMADDGVYECPNCRKTCSSRSGLTLHMKTCTGQVQERPIELKCARCGKKCSSTSGLTLHLKTCQGLEHDVWTELQEQEQQEEPALKCPTCGKQCSSTSGYTLHLKTHVE